MTQNLDPLRSLEQFRQKEEDKNCDQDPSVIFFGLSNHQQMVNTP